MDLPFADPPDVRERLQRHFPADAQLGVLALVGFYHTISNIANTADLEPEAWGRRLVDAG